MKKLLLILFMVTTNSMAVTYNPDGTVTFTAIELDNITDRMQKYAEDDYKHSMEQHQYDLDRARAIRELERLLKELERLSKELEMLKTAKPI